MSACINTLLTVCPHRKPAEEPRQVKEERVTLEVKTSEDIETGTPSIFLGDAGNKYGEAASCSPASPEVCAGS